MTRIFSIPLLLLSLLALFGLTACGGEGTPLVSSLPLTDDRPTFLFFYTDV